jgi:hypothetical protein
LRSHSRRRAYVDDVEPVDVEQSSLDEARMVLARTQAELPTAFNSAHATSSGQHIAEIEGQIEWLKSEAAQAVWEDAAAGHASDLWADYGLEITA